MSEPRDPRIGPVRPVPPPPPGMQFDEQMLKEAIAAKTGRAVDTIQIEKVWVEAKVTRADGTVQDLGVVSSSEPDEVTWKGDGDGRPEG